MRWLTYVIATCASSCLIGCPSTDPEPVDLPPAVPGDTCEPGAQRCVDDDNFEICRADGRGWFEKSCPTGALCETSSGTCQTQTQGCDPGEAMCTGSAGTAARSVCGDDGSGWTSSSCTGEKVCEPASGACVAPVCDAGESRCDAGPADPDRSSCAPDRLSFVSTPCSDSAVCVPTNDGSKCVTRICEPAEVTCAEDFTKVLRCDATGTAYEQVADCEADEACQSGTCQTSQTPLGEAVQVKGQGSLDLSPGQYALAVVNVDTTGDDGIDFPVTLGGAVKDTLVSFAPPPVVPPRLASGTSAMLRHRPTPSSHTPPGLPSPFPQDADEYVFQVPDYASGGTVVLSRTAKRRASGLHVNLWEDQTTAAAGSLLPDAVLSDLLARIDTAVIPRAVTMMGEPTDVDGNGKIDILFTDVLSSQVSAFSYPSATLFAPGSFTTTYDHGEVIYAHGFGADEQTWEVATLMSHEVAQLIYLGRRLTPYLDDPESVPTWVHADLYAVEGLASVAMGWSGQSWCWPAVTALEHPAEMSLWRLMASDYIQDSDANLASYGFGALVQEYLFDQAGAMKVQGGGSTFEDNGGLAYLQSFSEAESGWSRLAPVDGRDLSAWYVDFATALLLEDLRDRVSTETAEDRRYRFTETIQDGAFSGSIGPTLRWENTFEGSGAILTPSLWSQRPTQLRRGGLSLLVFDVDESGGELTVTEASTTAVVIRLVP